MSERPEPDGEPVRTVFVYGTLRPGRRNWAVAAPLCASHEAATLPGYGLYALAYPVVAPITGGGTRGDLLHLRPDRVAAGLDQLDAFEGVDTARPERSSYERVLTEVVTDDGIRHAAWVYLPGLDLGAQIRPDRRVPGDDWPR
jgi:gamma-glutamylcyclotransferase (GGCT)/AIG2-like uncharacterized protein YtfP